MIALTIRAGECGALETWIVRVDPCRADGRPVTWLNRATDHKVYAERVPDAVCAERATTTPQDLGPSLGHARKRARELARVLACGRAVECPGIVACVEGAPCPYGLHPEIDQPNENKR